PARLAHHADGAGDGPAVLKYAPVAARRAAALGAHREAAAQYARALRFADGLAPAARAELLGRHSYECYLTDQPPRARAPGGPRGARAELLERHSYECYLTDQLPEAIASREQALTCWRALRDRGKEGDTLRWLSRLVWCHGRHTEAERAGREAVELLEGLAPGPELAMAYSNLSQLNMLAGR